MLHYITLHYIDESARMLYTRKVVASAAQTDVGVLAIAARKAAHARQAC